MVRVMMRGETKKQGRHSCDERSRILCRHNEIRVRRAVCDGEKTTN